MVVTSGGREAVAKCDQCDWWARRRGEAPGVPEPERGSRIANFVTTEPTFGKNPTAGTVDALRQANYWLQGVYQDIYFFGPCGTGKTRLACSLLNERWTAGDRVEFVSCLELMNALMPGRDDDNVMLDRLSAVPVLCLDEVGGHQGTDFARRQLQLLYDRRLRQRLRTIWTSNKNLDGLALLLEDDRLSSRISGAAKIVKMECGDWRLRQQRQRVTSKGSGS